MVSERERDRAAARRCTACGTGRRKRKFWDSLSQWNECYSFVPHSPSVFCFAKSTSLSEGGGTRRVTEGECGTKAKHSFHSNSAIHSRAGSSLHRLRCFFSLRLGHARVLTPHRGVIHCARAASLPPGGGSMVPRKASPVGERLAPGKIRNTARFNGTF